jgi:hypothetical protein
VEAWLCMWFLSGTGEEHAFARNVLLLLLLLG